MQSAPRWRSWLEDMGMDKDVLVSSKKSMTARGLLTKNELTYQYCAHTVCRALLTKNELTCVTAKVRVEKGEDAEKV
eukprot:8776732-Lingulodinium_polyedra.AAC.1